MVWVSGECDQGRREHYAEMRIRSRREALSEGAGRERSYASAVQRSASTAAQHTRPSKLHGHCTLTSIAHRTYHHQPGMSAVLRVLRLADVKSDDDSTEWEDSKYDNNEENEEERAAEGHQAYEDDEGDGVELGQQQAEVDKKGVRDVVIVSDDENEDEDEGDTRGEHEEASVSSFESQRARAVLPPSGGVKLPVSSGKEGLLSV